MSDHFEHLRDLSSHMDLEPAEDADCARLSERQRNSLYVGSAQLPNGQPISLLKTLLTSACERDCYYCPFRSGRDFHRITLKPDEMADAFMALQRGGVVEGIFLSSGIAGGSLRTQDQLLATAEILRQRKGFKGYLHLKLMPGAERAQVEQAMRLANRVSVNLEGPNTQRLGMLAPRKQFLDELLQPLRWVEEIRRSQPAHQGWNGRWPSMVTQFVVGAVGESDLELLSTTANLQDNLRLGRAYFSAFSPITDTPFENLPPASAKREARLYQASFLLRDYGFDLEELPFQDSGNLPEDKDPKLAWALTNLADRPIEINRANREELLRIPGIGLHGVEAILAARRIKRLNDLSQVSRLGINAKRAAPFILLDGHRPGVQMTLW